MKQMQFVQSLLAALGGTPVHEVQAVPSVASAVVLGAFELTLVWWLRFPAQIRRP